MTPDQAVGDGIVQKLERGDRGVPGDDPGVLPSQQHEDSPEQVGELDRDEERPERQLGLCPLEGEGDAVVA